MNRDKDCRKHSSVILSLERIHFSVFTYILVGYIKSQFQDSFVGHYWLGSWLGCLEDLNFKLQFLHKWKPFQDFYWNGVGFLQLFISFGLTLFSIFQLISLINLIILHIVFLEFKCESTNSLLTGIVIGFLDDYLVRYISNWKKLIMAASWIL